MAEWVITAEKYLSKMEVRALCILLSREAEEGQKAGNPIPVRDWMIIDTALSTGLRVSEIANLKIGDVDVGYEEAFFLVRDKQGELKRKVEMDKSFTVHLMNYLKWERDRGTPLSSPHPLFLSERGSGMTTRAIQRRFKKWSHMAGLDPSYTIHSCRHTYAMKLVHSDHYDTAYVRKQLGYNSRQTALKYKKVDTTHKPILKEDTESIAGGNRAGLLRIPLPGKVRQVLRARSKSLSGGMISIYLGAAILVVVAAALLARFSGGDDRQPLTSSSNLPSLYVLDLFFSGDDLTLESSQIPTELHRILTSGQKTGSFPADMEIVKKNVTCEDRDRVEKFAEENDVDFVLWGTGEKEPSGEIRLQRELFTAGPAWSLVHYVNDAVDGGVKDFKIGIMELKSIVIPVTARGDSEMLPEILKSILLYRKGKYDECLPILEGMSSEIEEISDLRFLLANACIHSGDYTGAAAIYDNVLQESEEDVPALNNRMLCCALAGWFEKAKRDFDRLASIERSAPVVANSLGFLSLLEKNFADAYSFVRDSGKMDHEWREKAAEPNRAVVCRLAGNYREALKIYNRLLSGDEDSIRFLQGKAEALASLEEFTDAVRCYDRIVELDPGHWESWYNRGLICERQDKSEEALISFDRALEKNPESRELWLEKGKILFDQKNYIAASISIENSLRIDETFWEAWNQKAKLSAIMGKYKEALEYYRIGIECNPQNLEAWVAMAELQTEEGDYEEAEHSLAQAMKIDQKNYKVNFLNGITMRSQKRYTEAITFFDRAYQLAPEDPIIPMERGVAYLKQGKCGEALKDFDIVLKNDAGNIRALSNRGLALMLCKRYRESLTLYERLMREDSENVDFLLGMGYSLFQLDERDKAFTYFNRARMIDPESENIIKQMLVY